MSKARQNGVTAVTLSARTIQRECARLGWNQEELSRQSGLSRPTISIAFRGGLVTARTARRISDAFERGKPLMEGLVKTG